MNEDYAGLIVSGSPAPEALQSAWLSIYSEYTSLIGGANIGTFLRKVKQINVLHSKIARVQSLIDCLRLVHSPDLVEALNESGYPVIYEQAEDPEFYRALNLAEAKIKADGLRLQDLQRQMDQQDTSGKASAEDFELTLMEAAKFEGYAIPDTITTYKYCLHVQRLKRHIDILNKQNQKNNARNS